MGAHNLKYVTPSSFIHSILLVFILQVSVLAQDDVCKNVACGQGTCVLYTGSILGFDCACYNGWKKVQIGPVVLPGCIIPNCTTDAQCGNNAPPPPFELPPFNLTNPCSLMWCGDGTCLANGMGSYCQCNEGSANFLNSTTLPCFKQCSVGADCNGLELGPHVTRSPPKSNGSNSISKCSRSYALNMGLLSAVILSLIPTLSQVIS